MSNSDQVSLKQHRISVLLVDDSPLVGMVVGKILEAEGDVDYHYCKHPDQVIRMANEVSPTVILQDLVMPEIDGLDLVKLLRSNPATRDVPLIVLSGREEAVVKAEAFALGANDYMVKLPDELELVARIRYHSKGYISLLERNEAFGRLQKANYLIRQTFGRYLSDAVVDTILESPEGMSLGGEKRRVTIMMTDLRGFTAIGERLPAESVVAIINNYLEAMTDIIFKYEGTIDEFIGDAILAIFGAPIAHSDDAQRAVACALEMQLAMQNVNAKNLAQGYPDVAMGIGINTGEVVVGNIGSTKRTKYGIVGSNVNLASRIESYTIGGQILLSQSTRDECGSILRVDDAVQVMPKGVKEPITIYDVTGIGGELNVFLPEKEEVEFVALPEPIPVQFSILSDKHASDEVYEGRVERLAEKVAEVRAHVTPEKLENVKVSVFDPAGEAVTSDLYAKVTQVAPDASGAFTIYFASVPPEAEAYLEERIASGAT